MEAPEIIFLPIVNMGVEDGECTAPVWWNKDKTAEHSDVVKAIEYIRKDLLLEWAREMENCSQLSAPLLAHELIRKLNSL